MMYPKLDGRTEKDILSLIRKKSEVYTPEWRFDPEEPDAGAAIAQIFSGMFYETIDRYNRFPDKCYIEFLNMQGVCAKPVSPAEGMAAAKLVEGASDNVFISKGTQLFVDRNDSSGESSRIVFETSAGFFATPAELTDIYMTDPVRDIITRTETADTEAFPIKMFGPDEKDNIECHRFSISNDAVLWLNGHSEISVKISNTGMSFQNTENLTRLADPAFAQWSYSDGTAMIKLDAKLSGDHIVLSKTQMGSVAVTDTEGTPANEGGRRWLFCTLTPNADSEDIVVDRISLNSRSIEDEELMTDISPDHIFNNETELDGENIGFCFGKEPSVYDSLYIACDEAFSKRGALVTMELSVSPMLIQDNEITDGENIDFNNKLLIDKADTQEIPYDDIYISEVIWEYWNGFGWSRLAVKGDTNPFSCTESGAQKKSISFICPDDFTDSIQNAHSALWLRARIRTIENRFSTHARWLLPLIKSMSVHFDYGDTFLDADVISVKGNCNINTYEPKGAKLSMRLFGLMPEKHHAVYFRFDRMPAGYPVNLYFDIVGSTGVKRVITFEYLSGGRNGLVGWNELKRVDGTNSFENSGIISLYTPKDFTEAELFGQTGFWIRAVNNSMRFNPECRLFPKLMHIEKNTVNIIQKQSVRNELHEVFAGKAYQSFYLTNRPVIDCAVWINELPETPISKLREIAAADKDRARIVTTPAGEVTEFWIRWEQRPTLVDSTEEDRHYKLDATTGEISFGDGVNGKMPAYNTELQVSVDYSFGGGAAGNLPPYALDGLITGIPYVESMTNILSTCGGSNEQSIDTIRKIGTKRLKNYGRAVTAEDFEALVQEEFNEVAEVRCFTNRNRNSNIQNGYVTVVVVPHDFSNVTYTLSLCRRVTEFLSQRAGCELIAGNRLSVIPAVPMRVSTEISVQLKDYEHAAEVERDIIDSVSGMLIAGKGDRIGALPRVSDIMTALKKNEHIAYLDRVLLVGEYYLDNELITVNLDDDISYRYFVAVNGVHTVRL